MTSVLHLSKDQLEAGLDDIRESPKDRGVLKLLLRRPGIGERELLDEVRLTLEDGVEGDNWKDRPSSRTGDGTAHPDMQLNIMNSRAVSLIAQSKERWKLAGDQLYIDMDLSKANLPAGTRLALGEAVIEVTDQPHLGCLKFVERFGKPAMKFVNSKVGRELCLRGICAKVVKPGLIKVGDEAIKL